MTETERLALDFIRGVKGGPTSGEFDAQHAPLGPILLPKLINTGLARLASDGRVHLTAKGSAALTGASL